MVGCAHGASVKAGEPDYYAVTWTDLGAWVGAWNPLRLAMALWVGRSYKLADLAADNPDPPPPAAWSQFITGVLLGGPVGAAVVDYQVADAYIRYRVFLDHCICNPAPGGPVCTFDGPWSGSSHAYTTGHWCYSVGFTPLVSGYKIHYLRLVRGWSNGGISQLYVWEYGNTSPIYTQAIEYPPGPAGPVDFPLTTPVAVTQGQEYVIGTDLGAGNPWDNYLMSQTVDTPVLHPNFGGVGTGNVYGKYPDDQTEPWWHMTPVLCYGDEPYTPPAAGEISHSGEQTLPTISGTTNDQLAQQIYGLQVAVDTAAARELYLLERLAPITASLGDAIAGLTGHGTLSDPNAIAWLISSTGLPSGYEARGSEPGIVFGLGYLTLKGQGAWDQSVRLEHAAQILRVPSTLYSDLSYDLESGVTATITPIYGS